MANPINPDELSALPEENKAAVSESASPTSANTMRGKSGKTVMAVNAEEGLRVETAEDREKRDLRELTQSLRAKKILTGRMVGCEKTQVGSVAVIFYGSYKVIIPASDFLPNFAANGKASENVAYLAAVTNHLGAEIDFIVKAIDSNNNVIAASRSEAMKARQVMFEKVDTAGLYIFAEGTIHEARIVSVVREGIFVELNGFETYIHAEEISWKRISDVRANTRYEVGDNVLVYIKGIQRDKNGVQKLDLSIRQAAKNPKIREFQNFTVGGTYLGVVSYVSDSATIYVDLTENTQVRCEPLMTRSLPEPGTRVQVLIHRKDDRRLQLSGRITKVFN